MHSRLAKFALVTVALGAGLRADTVTLRATADALVWSANPTTAYGTTNSLQIGTNGGELRSYILWDFSSLASATINSVSLRMWAGSTGTAGTALVLGKASGSWSESSITWNNKPGDQVLTTGGYSLPAPTTQQLDFSDTGTALRDWVRAMVASPSSNFGMTLIGSGYYVFQSRESGVSKTPTLVIDYTPAPTYTLTTSVAQAGAGTVSRNPNQSTYVSGTNVQVTATQNAGYVFTHWSGDASGNANPLSVSMTGNKTITANFAVQTATVTATLTKGNGFADPANVQWSVGSQSGNGNPAALSAVPLNAAQQVVASQLTTDAASLNPWQARERWVDQGDTYTGSTTRSYARSLPFGNSISFSPGSSVAAGTSVTPQVVVRNDGPQRTVTVQLVLSTGKTLTSPEYNQTTASTTVVAGTTTAINLPAFVPAAGSYFSALKVTTLGLTGGNAVTDTWGWGSAITVNPTYTLTTSVGQAGWGTVSRNPNQSSYTSGTSVQVTATPNAGYVFTNWSGDASGTTNPLTVSMTGNKNITANFAVQSGGIAVTVKTIGGANYGAGAVVKRFTNPGYVYIDEATTNSSSIASWTGLSPGAYNIEVWSPASAGEYWGGQANVTVTGGQTASLTITRNEPYAPVAGGYKVFSGATDVTGGAVAVGTPLTHQVTVRNDLGFARNVKVVFRADINESAPYDLPESTSVAQSIPAGQTATFSFPHTPTTAGTYSRSFEVLSNTNGSNYVRTDSWAWNSAVTVNPTYTRVATIRASDGSLFDLHARPAQVGDPVSVDVLYPAIFSRFGSIYVTEHGQSNSLSKDEAIKRGLLGAIADATAPAREFGNEYPYRDYTKDAQFFLAPPIWRPLVLELAFLGFDASEREERYYRALLDTITGRNLEFGATLVDVTLSADSSDNVKAERVDVSGAAALAADMLEIAQYIGDTAVKSAVLAQRADINNGFSATKLLREYGKYMRDHSSSINGLRLGSRLGGLAVELASMAEDAASEARAEIALRSYLNTQDLAQRRLAVLKRAYQHAKTLGGDRANYDSALGSALTRLSQTNANQEGQIVTWMRAFLRQNTMPQLLEFVDSAADLAWEIGTQSGSEGSSVAGQFAVRIVTVLKRNTNSRLVASLSTVDAEKWGGAISGAVTFARMVSEKSDFYRDYAAFVTIHDMVRRFDLAQPRGPSAIFDVSQVAEKRELTFMNGYLAMQVMDLLIDEYAPATGWDWTKWVAEAGVAVIEAPSTGGFSVVGPALEGFDKGVLALQNWIYDETMRSFKDYFVELRDSFRTNHDVDAVLRTGLPGLYLAPSPSPIAIPPAPVATVRLVPIVEQQVEAGGFISIPVAVQGLASGDTAVISFSGFRTGTGTPILISTSTADIGTKSITINVSTQQSGQTQGNVVIRVLAPNTAPTISAISNQVTTIGQPLPNLAFTIGDAESAVPQLTLRATSSNAGVIPPATLALGGTGSSRTISIASPAVAGNSTITIFVDDGSLEQRTSFRVTVSAQMASLSLAANPASGGTVSGAGAFSVGSTQTIIATANVGFVFVSWNDGNTSASRQVVVPAGGATYTATFAPASYTLTTNVGQAGWGTVNPSGANSYAAGTSVQVTATPATGYVFTTWSGDATGTTNPLPVSMTANKNITANFALAPGNLNVTVRKADGSLYGSGAMVKRYNTAFALVDEVTTNASSVASWTGLSPGNYHIEVHSPASAGEYWGGQSNVPVTTGQTTNWTITRNEPYTQTYKVLSGSTEVTNGTVVANTPLTHEVTVRNGLGFARNVKVVFRADLDQAAPFDLPESTSVAQSVPGGQTRTFSFSHTPTVAGIYSRSFEVLSNTSGSTFIRSDSLPWAPAVTVSPAPASYTLTTAVSPAGSGTVSRTPNQTTFTEGASVSLSAVPGAGYAFSHWAVSTPAGGTTSTSSPLSLTMTANSTVTAVFEAAATGLLAWLKLDGNGQDATSNQFHGSVTAATATTDRANVAGGAMAFNGSSSYLSIANRGLDNVEAGDYTQAIWIKGTAAFTNRQSILQKQASGPPGQNAGWVLSTRENNSVFYTRDTMENGVLTAHTPLIGTTIVGNGAWHHIAVVRQGNQLSLYIDGQLEVSAATGAGPASNTSNLGIGRRNAFADSYFSGALDDFRYYSRALSASEVAQLAAVVPAGTSATHSVVGNGYVAGGTTTMTSTLAYQTPPTSLGWQVLLPAGWSLAASSGSEGSVKPVPGTTDLLEWAWITVPASPVTFSYSLNVPAGTTGAAQISALVLVRQNGAVFPLLAQPEPLVISPRPTRHTADVDGDGRISLLELTRIIELYNTRNGTTRTGAYLVSISATEDGFSPDPSRGSGDVVTLNRYHSADSSPRDGKLSLLELTRVIELYNYRAGTTRTGQYRVQAGTEDGYAPGP